MEKQEIRTFGRRHGKKLSARQTRLIDVVLPTISYKNIQNNDKIILEIGFGAGEHLRELAIKNTDKIIIGAEPFINGVASLLSSITNNSDDILPEYSNIRVWADDVRQMLRDSELKFDEIWILHPDPWPKAKHEKRRLLSAEFLNTLGQHLTQNGEIIIGTDHWGYYEWIVDQSQKTNLTRQTPEINTIKTRYQNKNMAGTDTPKYLILTKPLPTSPQPAK